MIFYLEIWETFILKKEKSNSYKTFFSLFIQLRMYVCTFINNKKKL